MLYMESREHEVPATYEPIATQTIGSNSSSVVFNSIPQTYTDLVLTVDSRFTLSSGRWIGVRCNNDTGSNYYTIYFGGTGSSPITANFADTVLRLGNGSASGARSNVIGHIADYTNTTNYKPSISRATTNEYTISYASSWRGASGSPQAITSLTFTCDTAEGNQFLAGSVFSIYGIKAA